MKNELKKENEMNWENINYIYSGLLKGIKEIKREERDEWHKGGRVSDCEKGENAIHFWATVSTAKRAHFLCEILRESSKKSISIHIRLIQKKSSHI